MENKQFMHSYHIGLIRFWLVGETVRKLEE